MWEKVKGFIAKEWLMLLVVIANFAAGLYLGPKLPDRVPMHWNVYGQVDRYGSKDWAVFGMPFIILGIYLLMILLPKIDPKKMNYSLFEGTYKVIRMLILLVFSSLYGITTVAALGNGIKIDKVVPLVVAVMFAVFGNYMGRVRQNFFVGIKTPWTLIDPEIWTKTHRFAGKLWTAGGLVLIVTSLLLNGTASFTTFIIITLIIGFYPIVYSYLLFRQKKTE